MIVYAHASEEKCGSIGPLPPRGTRPAICCWPQLSHTPQAHMDTSFLTAIYPALPPNLCICMAPNHMSFLRSLALSAAFCRLSEWVQAPNISHGCLCSPDGLMATSKLVGRFQQEAGIHYGNNRSRGGLSQRLHR